MYDMYYLNFISPIPRELLEMVASAAVESNSTQQIAKVRHIKSLANQILCEQLMFTA